MFVRRSRRIFRLVILNEKIFRWKKATTFFVLFSNFTVTHRDNKNFLLNIERFSDDKIHRVLNNWSTMRRSSNVSIEEPVDHSDRKSSKTIDKQKSKSKRVVRTSSYKNVLTFFFFNSQSIRNHFSFISYRIEEISEFVLFDSTSRFLSSFCSSIRNSSSMNHRSIDRKTNNDPFVSTWTNK